MRPEWAFDQMSDLQLIRAIEKWNNSALRHSPYLDTVRRERYHEWIHHACEELIYRSNSLTLFS